MQSMYETTIMMTVRPCINRLTYNDELESSFISSATVDFDESDSSRADFSGRRKML